MSCVPSDPRFRLLDHRVGWDAEHHDYLTGLKDSGGVRLIGGTDGITASILDPYIPPPRLARGCEPCNWYLATKPAPRSLIKSLNGCTNQWHLTWRQNCTPITLESAIAIAVDRRRIAVADAGTGRVWIMLLKDAQVLAKIKVDQPRDLSFGPAGEIVVVVKDGHAIQRFSFNGRSLGPRHTVLPAVPVARIAHDRIGRLWLATEHASGRFRLYAQEKTGAVNWVAEEPETLAQVFTHTDAVRSNRSGFCLRRGGASGTLETLCWDWFGRSLAMECVTDPSESDFVIQGQLLTKAIDSGIPRCRWHRLIVDAEIPGGTRLEIAVATSESPMPASQGVSDPEWALFPAGLPHPSDWQVLPAGLTEALLRCPAGRYLFMRLKLSGDGSTTPRVRRIHIDFPRSTSADLLPAVFRQDAAAGDFTERFLGLFDASLETVDAAIARFPALIDGARTRDEVLPWIAHFLSITLDQTWDADTRRRMLKAAPDLFRRRGTRTGLNRSIRLAYNLNDDPAIIEHGLERVWGAVADKERPVAAAAQLGHTRLFSRNRARLTLGASPLDQTPVMSYGNPVTDPHSVGAFRFTVSLPVSAGVDEAVLSRLVESQKPAHTLATLRTGSANGFRLGGQLRLGIDTLVVRPRPQVLNEPGTWLAHNSILGGETPPGPILGHSALSDPRTAAPSLSYPE